MSEREKTRRCETLSGPAIVTKSLRTLVLRTCSSKGNECISSLKQEAHQLVQQAKRNTTKIRPKAVVGGIFGCFSYFDKWRSEVAGDDISSVAVD